MSDMHVRSDIAEIARGLADTVHAFAGKTVLVSGGCGFLGYYFTDVFLYLNRSVLEVPCRLIVVDNLMTSGGTVPFPETSRDPVLLRHNIVEPVEWDEPVDFIVHAAGIASPYYYLKYPVETLDVATVGTKNMLNLAMKYRAKFLFLSSSEIYGDPDSAHVPTAETYRGNVSCVGPRACYDESKRVGETLTYIFHQHFGTAATIVRPFNVYGPGMRENDYRVLPNFGSCIVGRRPLPVYGSGTQTRTYCYITDAMVGFIKALVDGLPGEAYNIGNARPEISVLGLVKQLERVLGHPLDVVRGAYPENYPRDEPMRRCPDISKARAHLNYEPKVNLDEGLSRFLGWARTTYSGRA